MRFPSEKVSFQRSRVKFTGGDQNSSVAEEMVRNRGRQWQLPRLEYDVRTMMVTYQRFRQVEEVVDLCVSPLA